MSTPRINFHIIPENPNDLSSIRETLQDIDYDVMFSVCCKETLEIGGNGFDIVMVEPSTERWEWLDVLVKVIREHPEVPLILYSPETRMETGFPYISEGSSVYVINNLRILKQRLAEVVQLKQETRKKILFVDDDPAILEGYRHVLHKTPWDVLTASSARKALEILRTEQIDLVVTDVKMPNIHGLELISRIRQRHKSLPIVVCSGYRDMRQDSALQLHDIACFLEKPLNTGVLEGTLREIL